MSSSQITAIITTYKRPKLLKRAIQSFLSQTYTSFQVCVYDNASEDGTAEIVADLQKKDQRIKYHCHPENIGMMGNYQYALSHVKTPFFSFLSDDDVALPTFFETVLKGFAKHPDVIFSAGSTIIVNEKKEVVDVALDGWENEGYYLPPRGAAEMIGKWIPPAGIVFRAEALKDVRIDANNQIVWDCDFLMQVSARHSFYIVKEPCAIFLRHGESFSASQSSKFWSVGIQKMIENLDKSIVIASPQKNLLLEQLSANLKERALHCIGDYILRKKFEEAVREVEVFRKKYGSNAKLMLLSFIAKTPFFFSLGSALIKIIKSIKHFPKKKVNSRKYANIVRYMFDE